MINENEFLEFWYLDNYFLYIAYESIIVAFLNQFWVVYKVQDVPYGWGKL